MPASSYVSLVRRQGLHGQEPLTNSQGEMEKVL